MTPLLKKLNYKNHPEIYVLNAPIEFETQLELMQEFAEVKIELGSKSVTFILVFVNNTSTLNGLAPLVVKSLANDAVLYFCYPKQTSKKYTCDFNRDTGWQLLGTLGFEPVRQVAIDEDWSALRFRKPEHIKKMSRSFALTKEGKQKAEKGKSKG